MRSLYFTHIYDWLVVSTPLKNMKVTWKDDIPYIMENIKNDPNHQPDDITILEVHHGPLVHHIYIYMCIQKKYIRIYDILFAKWSQSPVCSKHLFPSVFCSRSSKEAMLGCRSGKPGLRSPRSPPKKMGVMVP